MRQAGESTTAITSIVAGSKIKIFLHALVGKSIGVGNAILQS